MNRINSQITSHLRRDYALNRAKWLAHWMDSSIAIPGTKYTIGIDPLIGVIPGIGDAFSYCVSAIIIWDAANLGVSKTVLMRMIANLCIDALIGAIPVLGDIFDFTFKGNARNLKILQGAIPLSSSPSAPMSNIIKAGLILFIITLALLSLLVAGGIVLLFKIF